MNWIKAHKLLTASIVAGVVVLYYLYKNMQANAAAAAAGSTAAFPAYPTVIYGGGGGGAVASTPGGSQGNLVQVGTDANGNPIYGQPGTSLASTQAAAPSAPVASPAAVAATPGANPAPVVSAPAASDVSSAVVNSHVAGNAGQAGMLIPGVGAFGTPTASPSDLGWAGMSSVNTGGYNLFKNGVYQGGPNGNAPAYDLPGSPNGWTGPATPVPFIGGGGGFPSVPGHTPMIPMASAGPSLPLNQPQPNQPTGTFLGIFASSPTEGLNAPQGFSAPLSMPRAPAIGPTQNLPGGSLA